MQITKKSKVTASHTIQSIEWGKTAVIPEATIQAIANDIQSHLDSVYPELNLECFVDIVKDYRDYQVFHIHTYPAQGFEPVLKYRVYLHDTTVAYMWDNIVEEFDLDLRKDYADTVCDIITKHVSTLPGRVTGSTISAATQYPKTLKYLYVSEDLSEYPESVQAEYEDVWDELWSTWEANPRRVPTELWKSSEALITKEDGWLQVSWGGLDNYQEFATLAECKSHVADQYAVFRWMHKSTATQDATATQDDGSIVLKQYYIYDTISNLRNNGWDEVLDFFLKNNWTQGNRVLIPGDTKLVKVGESRYHYLYKITTDKASETLPFLKPEFGGDELV